MENTKSNFGTLEENEGRYDIVLYDAEPKKLRPSSQYEMKNMELVFDGSICTITGERRTYQHYLFDTSLGNEYSKKELEKAFDARDIKYKKKIIKNWFRKDSASEEPYLNGWVRVNEYVSIKIVTPCWALYDKRAKPEAMAESVITDISGMD